MQMPEVPATPSMEPLALLLLERGAHRVDAEAVRRVIDDVRAGHWSEQFEELASGLGMHVRWSTGTVIEAAEVASWELPLVTCAPDRFGRLRWWMIDGVRFGRVRLTRLGDGMGASWLGERELAKRIGREELAWAMVEPMLPASALRATGDKTPSPWRRLMGLLHLERRDMAVIVVYGIILGVLSLATPLAMQVLINWLAFGALLQPVVVLGSALFLFLGLAAALRTMQRLAVEMVQRRIFVRMAADLSGRLSRVDVPTFDRIYGPELVNRFFDVLTIQKAVRTLLLDGLAALLQAGVGLLVLALYHPVLLVFDLVVIGAIAIVWGPLAKGAVASAVIESKKKYEVAGWIEEMARHPLLFKLGGTSMGVDRADRLTRGYLEARATHFSVFMRQYVGMQGISVFVSTTLLVLCGWLVLEGELTLGQLVAAEFIMTSALLGLAKFTDKLDTTYDLLAAIDKIGALVDIPGERTAGLRRKPAAGPATVELREVGFSYPSTPGGVRGVGLTLTSGSRTAIFGVPGSGKSLLADLVLGVRVPTHGQVIRDAVDARLLHPETLHQDAVLLRGADLIAGSIRDNITLGRPGIDTEEVLACLTRVGLDEVVATLPEGLETRLSPEGRPLSAGQARALVVARALAGNPRLVIVDGFFDGLAHQARAALMRPLVQDSRFTLLVFTQDASLAHLVGAAYELTDGGLSARPRLSTV